MMNLKNVFCQNGEILGVIQSLDPLHNPLYQIQDEITFGRLFADTFQSVLKYNVTAKQWYVYDGVIWKEDTGSVIVGRLAEKFQRMLKVYLADAVSDNETQFETAYQKYVLRLGDRNKRLKMIEDAKHHTFISMLDFDSNKNLLNVQNGVINLETMEFSEHNSADLLTRVCKCSYDPEADPKEWIKFVNEIFENDQEKIDYVQRLFGYALTADRIKEEFYMFYGKTTRNGKDTLLGTMGTMMGSYGNDMNPESLKDINRKGNQTSEDIARLRGCRFVHCSEPPKSMIIDIALIKKVTGSKKIPARNLYEKTIEFVPEFKLFMNTNYRPVVNDMTLFTSYRVKVIECNRHFTEEEQDHRLKEKLESDYNLSALLNWCLAGLQSFRENENVIPDSVKQAVKDYSKESDKMQNFINDCIESKSEFNLPMKRAYDAYKGWCLNNGYRSEGKKGFKEMLSAKIPISDSGTVNGMTYKNVLLNHTLTQDGRDCAAKVCRDYDS